MKDEDRTKEQLMRELADLRQQLAILKEAEAQRQRADQILRSIVEGTAAVTGSDFFRSLVRQLASALQVRYALITECTDATLSKVRTLAFWADEEFQENFVYDLADTPCHNVVAGATCYYPRNAQALFPNDDDLRRLGVESYLGVPILSSTGAPLGHLAVMDGKPMPDEPHGAAVMRIFAARAGAELERLRAEQALRESEARLHAAIESLPFNLWVCGREGRYIRQNSASMKEWGNLIGRQLEELDLAPAIFKLWEDHNRRAFAGEVIKEEVSYTRDGETRVYYDIVAPIRFENEVRGILGVNIDITERKRVEAQLEQRARQLAALSHMGQTVTASLDLDEVLNKVIHEVLPLLGAEGVSVLLLETRDELVFAATSETCLGCLRGQRMPATAGVAGEVVRTGRSSWIHHVTDQARIYRDVEKVTGYYTQSLLAVPLQLGDEIIGVMEAVHQEPEAFSADDLRVLEAAANWAAIAIGNARLFEATRRQLQELIVVHAVATLGAETTDEDALIEHATQIIGKTLYPDSFGVLLLDQSTGTLRCHPSYRGASEEVKALMVPPGRHVTGAVAARGQPWRLPDVLNEPAYYAADPTIRSELCVPLKAGERVIGVINAESRRANAFSEDDERLLATVAGQLATAIERARLLEAERAARDRLRWLTQQVVSAQEEERQRVSRELHDEAGQALTALKIGLELMHADLPFESESLRRRMAEAVALTDTTMEQIRLLAQGLRPPALDAVGLALTLEGFCRDFAERTRLSIRYTGANLPALPGAVNIALYRFLQEALTNVAKHAHANRVGVTLRYDAGAVSLSIEDDGQGFDQQGRRRAARRPATGIGLLGMQERFELLGGRVSIESRPGNGTRLTAYAPVPEAAGETMAEAPVAS